METNKPRLNVGFFFLCLGLLITLITSVVSFLSLVFNTLDKRFPDILNSNYQYGYSSYDYESIRASLATLIIFFPIFFIVSYFWKKFTKGEMGDFDKIIKKWVTYIILFLSSLVVAIDLVVLVRYFISGEITIRFVYKVISIFIVASLVGKNYYVLEVWKCSKKLKKIFYFIYAIFSIVLVVVAVSYSFFVMGSPAKQRMFRLDDRRVSDLQSIQSQVINYWQQKEKLPVDLTLLSNPLTGYSLPVPPEFNKGEQYEYKVIGKLKFELCANFSLPAPKGWAESNSGSGMGLITNERSIDSVPAFPVGGINQSWDHGQGRTCFDRTIDKDIYPPFEKNINR